MRDVEETKPRIIKITLSGGAKASDNGTMKRDPTPTPVASDGPA